MSYLKEEAINEIMEILRKVRKVQDIAHEFGICYSSDSWSAIIPPINNQDKENILEWTRKDFERLDGDFIGFNIGGSVSSIEARYNHEYVKEPEALAIEKGNFILSYLQNIVKTSKPLFFELQVKDNGLYEDCGWEHFIVITATIKENAINNERFRLRNCVDKKTITGITFDNIDITYEEAVNLLNKFNLVNIDVIDRFDDLKISKGD